jgi:hypothetical protein
MTTKQVLDILSKKTYLVDKTNEDNIIPLNDHYFGVETTKNSIYILLDFYDIAIGDKSIDIYKISNEELESSKELMGIDVVKVADKDEYDLVCRHINSYVDNLPGWQIP